jgi:hypothetical protein
MPSGVPAGASAMLSILKAATIFPSGSGGFAAKAIAPSSPSSSAVVDRK